MAFPQYGSPSKTEPRQGDTPGLGQMMQRLLAGGRPQQGGAPAPAGAPPGGASMPPPAPAPGAPGVPGAPPMPPPNPPVNVPGMTPGMPTAGISPEEMQAMMEQVKGELMKSIAGQSGQQDRIFEASRGLASYRPMGGRMLGGPMSPNPQPYPPQGMPQGPQDVQFPPGMAPQGLENWKRFGNPNGPQASPQILQRPLR